jgi:hypothetical protein
MTDASRVGRPAASSRLSSGTGIPWFFATRALPIAILLVAMSSSTAGPSSPGSAAQKGLVLSRASAPP